MPADLPPPFVCIVRSVVDADTIKAVCNGRMETIRIAGINAREKDGTCRPGAPCPRMLHAQAKPIVEHLTLHKRLTFRPVDRSWKRIVAIGTLPDGSDLSCAITRTGAAVWWTVYVRRYRMGGCRG